MKTVTNFFEQLKSAKIKNTRFRILTVEVSDQVDPTTKATKGGIILIAEWDFERISGYDTDGLPIYADSHAEVIHFGGALLVYVDGVLVGSLKM